MKSKRSGMTFVMTVALIATLISILAAAAATQNVMVRTGANRMWHDRAKLAAESGVQMALATLASQTPTATTQQDDWFTLGGTNADQRFVVGDGAFRIQVVDAASLININTATQAQLQTLPLTSDQIDSILDWREAGTTARADGAKDDYYTALPTPYNTKLRRFDTPDELLLVKGFTPDLLFNPQTNTSSTGTVTLPQKRNGDQYSLYDLITTDSVSAASGTTPIANANPATLAQQLGLPPGQIGIQQAQGIINSRPTTYQALLAFATNNNAARTIVNTYRVSTGATATGKIDLNTATEAVLDSVPNLTPDLVQAIISQQSTGFTQLGDLFTVSGMNLQVGRQVVDYFTVSSQTFLVRVEGTFASANVSLEALVTLSNNTARITRIFELPYPDMAQRWGWVDTTTADTTLKEPGTQ